LPSLDRVAHALDEARLLLLVVDGEPVLDEIDAGEHQHLLKERAGTQELGILLVGAEAHDALDPGAVVPTAVEEDHLAACRQMGDIALEIPLPALLLGGRPEGDNTADARVEARRDALDDPTFARRIATLEDDDDFEAFQTHPLL